MDVEELYRRYAAGDRDFQGVDLSHANLNVAKVRYLEDLQPGQNELSGINLSGANLTSANLTYVNLSGANLSSANLKFAELSCTVLTGADLRKAILDYAQLGCDLIDVDLREATLFGTVLIGTNLTRSNLMGAKFQVMTEESGIIFCDTIMPDGTINSKKWPERNRFNY
ncbi:pentapeptide repeat-containing protein [Kamptonema sp. UHCC 0994]|uniref:pentapeptide repeat-containing protein n=1 Tax=Kamptonema sp. UHCC 0994 TaxID=3031329 RepID=UPI0023B90EEE|nr:pentapeptide repeat-containing protein [Kamptonema sp. UHCC 0994]MDF0554731.1 pentapeptide repeat-containing protein [Kamptonema sp. UHCC 0994]